MAQMKYFKIKVTVDSVAGKCPLGNIPGKEFIIERRNLLRKSLENMLIK